MKGRLEGWSFGAAVWVLASTELISATMGGGLRVQVAASGPGTLPRNRGRCRSTRRYHTRRLVVAPGQLQQRCHDPAATVPYVPISAVWPAAAVRSASTPATPCTQLVWWGKIHISPSGKLV